MLSKHTSAGQNYTLLKENRIPQMFWQAEGWDGGARGGAVFHAGSWERWVSSVNVFCLFLPLCAFVFLTGFRGGGSGLQWDQGGSNTWLAMWNLPRQLRNMCGTSYHSKHARGCVGSLVRRKRDEGTQGRMSPSWYPSNRTQSESHDCGLISLCWSRPQSLDGPVDCKCDLMLQF